MQTQLKEQVTALDKRFGKDLEQLRNDASAKEEKIQQSLLLEQKVTKCIEDGACRDAKLKQCIDQVLVLEETITARLATFQSNTAAQEEKLTKCLCMEPRLRECVDDLTS